MARKYKLVEVKCSHRYCDRTIMVPSNQKKWQNFCTFCCFIMS